MNEHRDRSHAEPRRLTAMRGVGLLAIATLAAAMIVASAEPLASSTPVAMLATEPVALDNAGCIRCHSAQAEEWLGSPHQTAFVESTFQTAHAIEPRAFCRSCHAPEADPRVAHETDASRLGVACVSCHVRDGSVLAAPLSSDAAASVEIARLRPASSAPAPHPLTRSADFATARACATCHEFDFPDTVLRDRPLAMQSTVREHAASEFADRSCASCHMPRAADGHHSHRFVASRDPIMLREAVRIDAQRIDARTLALTLRPGRVGHAVPTGDLLRRLEVGAVARRDDGTGRPRRRFLARHFGDRAQQSGIIVRDELDDDRIPPTGERVVKLVLPDADGAPIDWWVDYQRVAHHRSARPADAIIDDTIRLAAGTLPSSSTTRGTSDRIRAAIDARDPAGAR